MTNLPRYEATDRVNATVTASTPPSKPAFFTMIASAICWVVAAVLTWTAGSSLSSDMDRSVTTIIVAIVGVVLVLFAVLVALGAFRALRGSANTRRFCWILVVAAVVPLFGSVITGSALLALAAIVLQVVAASLVPKNSAIG